MIPLESWEGFKEGDIVFQIYETFWLCSTCPTGICYKHFINSIFTFIHQLGDPHKAILLDERKHRYAIMPCEYFSRTEEVAPQPLSNASSRTLCPLCSTPLQFKALSDWCSKCDKIYGD